MKIQWLVNGVSGNSATGYFSSLASNRYRAILPAQGLIERGHDVELVSLATWDPDTSDAEVVVLGKLLGGDGGAEFEVLSRRWLHGASAAQQRGIRIVVDVNDNHFDHPLLGRHWRESVRLADCVAVGSPAMAELVHSQSSRPVVVVGDPTEATRGTPAIFRHSIGWTGHLERWLQSVGYLRRRLALIWYGNPMNWPSMAEWAERLVPIGRRQQLLIRVVSMPGVGIERFVDEFNGRHAPAVLMEFIQWHQETVWEWVAASHVVMIPSDVANPKHSVKTANRLTDAIVAGRFAVASPLPSYREYEQCAWLGDDPAAGIAWYLDHPDIAMERLVRGQHLVESNCSVDAVAAAWEHVFEVARTAPPVPLVSETDNPGGKVAPGSSPVLLNLGCGDKLLDGYINVDIAESRRGLKPDVLCDLRRLDCFPDDYADEALSVHVVEHFWRWEVADILREWIRVLKPGGRLIVECPNLLSACAAVVADPDGATAEDARGQRSMWVLYGDPAWQDPLMTHRWGYTPQSLGRLMEDCGLVNVRQESAQFKLREPRDMRLVGEKPGVPMSARPVVQHAARIGAAQAVAAKEEEMSSQSSRPVGIDAGEAYHHWYYEQKIWKAVSYHGIRTLKLPSDMWNYQEIIFERGIDYVVETGTRHGGSALFFADTLAARTDRGFVISIDIDDSENHVGDHPRIRFLLGDSAGPDMVRRVLQLLPAAAERGPCFWILDSDHSRDHVLRELEAYVPVMKAGDYLIVEDSNVNGHPVRPDFGPGPWEAVQEFLARHPGLLVADKARETKFGLTFATDGYFVRTDRP